MSQQKKKNTCEQIHEIIKKKIPMLMFFLPGPVAFVMSDFLERVLKRHEPTKEEKYM